jgi:glycosyltransferase involved in cell wall biosynthesis
MKILMLIKRFEIGGAEDHVLELANSLCARGIEIHLLCKPGRKLSELHPEVKFHSICFKSFLIPFTVFRLLKIIKREKIDLIHAHQNYPILAACIAGWLTGVPIIATIHGLLKKEVGSEFIQRQLGKVIVVSKNSFTGSQKYSILKNKAELIHNPLPKSHITSHLYDKNKIVYACRVDRGHYSFIQLLLTQVMPQVHDYNKNISIQVVGDGNSFVSLTKTAAKINYEFGSNTVELLGYRKNILEVISKAGLVIGVGRVAMQALSLGIPVISANRKHMCSIISLENYRYMRDNNFVSVDDPPPSKDQIALSILRLFTQYEYYKEQAFQLAKKVNDDYNQDAVIARTISVYQTCMTYALPEPIASVK